MCEYHLDVGDMFRTPHGLGLIIAKKNSKFHYTTIFRVDGGDIGVALGVSQIPTKSFYASISTGDVEEVYMADRKYRRKRK